MGIVTLLSSILAVVVSLALVLGLAWGALWLLRKGQGRLLGVEPVDADTGRSLRFLRALPLGQRERVALIDVGGDTMLLGIGAAGVSLLAHWDADGRLLPVPPASPARTPGGSSAAAFAALTAERPR